MAREKVYVVDKNDVVVGEKWRDETEPKDRIRIVSIWVENDNDEVLIARRSITRKIHPGLWGPSAAGGVTVGDSYTDSAKKELYEELGLSVDAETIALNLINKYTYGKSELGDGLRMMAVFEVKLNWSISQFTIQEDEVSEIKWISKKKLLDDLQPNSGEYLPHATTWTDYLVS